MNICFKFCVMAIFSTCIGAATTIDAIMATIDSQVITSNEFTKRLNTLNLPEATLLNPNLKQQVMQHLIDEKLQLALAQQHNLSVSSDEIHKATAQIAAHNELTVAELKQKLSTQGVAIPDFEAKIKNELLISKVQQQELNSRIRISSQDIKNKRQELLNEQQKQDEYLLAHILLTLGENPSSAEREALGLKAVKIHEQLTQGADFSELAREYSKGAQALSGGNLGWRKFSELPDYLASTAKTLNKHEISPVITQPQGYHLIKLLDKKTSALTKEVTQLKIKHITIPVDSILDEEFTRNKLVVLRQALLENSSSLAALNQDEYQIGAESEWISDSELSPLETQVLESLAKNQYSQPYRTDLGWRMTLITDLRFQLQDTSSLDHVIRENLYQARFQDARTTWLAELRDKATIHIIG